MGQRKSKKIALKLWLRLVVIMLSPLILLFQNCSKGFQLVDTDSSSSLSSNSDPGPGGPPTGGGTIDTNLMKAITVSPEVGPISFLSLGIQGNKLFGYSQTIGQLISIDQNTGLFSPINISSTPAISTISGASLLANSNLIEIIFYDMDGHRRAGIYNPQNSQFTAVFLNDDCGSGVYGVTYPVDNLILLVCASSYSSNSYSTVQKMDMSGQLLGSAIRTSELIKELGRSMGPNRVALDKWTKVLNLTTGQVSPLFSTPIQGNGTIVSAGAHDFEYNSGLYISYRTAAFYRADRDTVVFATDEDVRERKVSDGTETIIFTSNSQPIGVDILTGSFYASNLTSNLYFSPLTASFPMNLSSKPSGFALSESHIAFFYSDPSSATLKLSADIFPRRSDGSLSHCPSSASTTPFVRGHMNGSLPDPYYYGSIATLSADCRTLFLSGISPNRIDFKSGTAYISSYDISTGQTQNIYSQTVTYNGSVLFGTDLTVSGQELLTLLPRDLSSGLSSSHQSLYHASAASGLVKVTDSEAYSVDQFSSYSPYVFQTSSGQIGMVDSSLGSVSQVPSPKMKLSPQTSISTSKVGKFVLVFRERGKDVAGSDNYTIRYYNADGSYIKSDYFGTQLTRTSLSPYLSPYQGASGGDEAGNYTAFRLTGQQGVEDVSRLLVIDIENGNFKTINIPSSPSNPFPNLKFLPNGDSVSMSGGCSLQKLICDSSLLPDLPAPSTDHSSFYIFSYHAGDVFVSTDSSFLRYHRQSDGSYTQVASFAAGNWQFYPNGSFAYLSKPDATLQLNLQTNAVSSLPPSPISVILKDGFLSLQLDETTQKYKLSIYRQSTGTLTLVDQYSSPDFLTASETKDSDLILLFDSSGVSVLNLTTQKIERHLSIDSGFYQVGQLSPDVVILGRTSSTTPDGPSPIVYNKKTGETKLIDITGLSYLICSQRALGTGTYCSAQKNNKVVLFRLNTQSLTLEELATPGPLQEAKIMDVSSQLSLVGFNRTTVVLPFYSYMSHALFLSLGGELFTVQAPQN